MTVSNTLEEVAWDELFERAPEHQIVLWARERSISRDELYSVVTHALRASYISQVRSRNFILLTLTSKPYEHLIDGRDASTRTGARSTSFGRGKSKTDTPTEATQGFPRGRGNGHAPDNPGAKTRAPKPPPVKP
jgi:hypothetical protein